MDGTEEEASMRLKRPHRNALSTWVLVIFASFPAPTPALGPDEVDVKDRTSGGIAQQTLAEFLDRASIEVPEGFEDGIAGSSFRIGESSVSPLYGPVVLLASEEVIARVLPDHKQVRYVSFRKESGQAVPGGSRKSVDWSEEVLLDYAHIPIGVAEETAKSVLRLLAPVEDLKGSLFFSTKAVENKGMVFQYVFVWRVPDFSPRMESLNRIEIGISPASGRVLYVRRQISRPVGPMQLDEAACENLISEAVQVPVQIPLEQITRVSFWHSDGSRENAWSVRFIAGHDQEFLGFCIVLDESKKVENLVLESQESGIWYPIAVCPPE